MSYNLAQNDNGDNISRKFVAYVNEENKKILKAAFKESKGSVNISEELQNAVADFPGVVRCE